MTQLLAFLLLLQSAFWHLLVGANTEKIIFLAPDVLTLPSNGPSLGQLRLQRLSPSAVQLNVRHPVVFSNASFPRGLASWYILSELDAAQRYEVRVCWAATVSAIDKHLETSMAEVLSSSQPLGIWRSSQ